MKLRSKLPEHELRLLNDLLNEQDRREREALRLYEPLDWQAEFHKCTAVERICIAANQDGKSLAAYAELGRAVTGQDPYNKYPKTDGIAVIVGYDEKFIGLNPYRYLLKKGAFKIIKNAQGQWESWKPWVEDHWKRKDEAKPAPPILEKRFLKKAPAWLKKKDHIFSKIELTTGWTILAFGSKGDPPPGFQADLILFDEDIDKAEWYPEMVARTTIRSGKVIWAALPLMSNDELQNLIDRAEEEVGQENPTTVRFSPTGPNPFVDVETRERNAKRWKASGEDVYQARALGNTSQEHRKMYPSFDARFTHNAMRMTEPFTEVQLILKQRNGMPPADWTRYMVVDPGHAVCAVLFMATPPPNLGDFRVAYQELYLRKCDAEIFAKEVNNHWVNWYFEQFIIDAHGGRLREIGSGLTPREQYEAALARRGIRSGKTGSGFIDGCDHIAGRTERLRHWLRVRPDGTPTLYVVEANCPNLCRELKNFKKKLDPRSKLPTDEGLSPKNFHATACLEYAAAHGCAYVKPGETQSVTEKDQWLDDIRRKQRMEAMSSRSYGCVLGATG